MEENRGTKAKGHVQVENGKMHFCQRTLAQALVERLAQKPA